MAALPKCFESCLESLDPGCPKAAFPNFQKVTTALEDGLASYQFSNISQIIFFLHPNSQSTAPLMHSLPHAAKQAAGQELGQSLRWFGVSRHSHDRAPLVLTASAACAAHVSQHLLPQA